MDYLYKGNRIQLYTHFTFILLWRGQSREDLTVSFASINENHLNATDEYFTVHFWFYRWFKLFNERISCKSFGFHHNHKSQIMRSFENNEFFRTQINNILE